MDDVELVKTAAIDDSPLYLYLPTWGPPGILAGGHPRNDFSRCQMHHYTGFPYSSKAALGFSPDEKLKVILKGDINLNTFARAIARIGYCQAVAWIGLDGFNTWITPKLILWKYRFISHFVGSEIKLPAPPNSGSLHKLEGDPIYVGKMLLFMVSIRLFANGGTPDCGFPIYNVVVGLANSRKDY